MCIRDRCSLLPYVILFYLVTVQDGASSCPALPNKKHRRFLRCEIWCKKLFTSQLDTASVSYTHLGHLLEWICKEKWWDYSNVKWNLDGYVCLPISLLWGFLGFVTLKWGNGLLVRVYHLVPSGIGKILIWVVLAALTADVLATLIVLSGKSRQIERWESMDSWFEMCIRDSPYICSFFNRIKSGRREWNSPCQHHGIWYSVPVPSGSWI